jgi:hypothetical protein
MKDRACGTERKEVRILVGKSEGPLHHLENFGVDGKIILKRISNRT